ncbi:hypothetical protein NLI96_g6764 [Meripilus lineatus]|uniref:Uncharacterized protein n=1 Tax=Meripilus lineatus TaxID=2056292 RepID=A0AAD5V0Z9_9APHY|nr:hypothetical protein NLI96_g6764 [Physisporinus lineatus]
MPVKSGFRSRPKAFTGGRKPFNLAEAEANADAGWSRHKPENELPRSMQTNICDAYENVKQKVYSLFGREPTKSERVQSDARPALTKTELRRREVAAELFPANEPPCISNNRKRYTEFKFKKTTQPMVVDTPPVDTTPVDDDSVMSNCSSLFAWSSTDTLVYDVEMSDAGSAGAKHNDSPMIIEDWGQAALCDVFNTKLNLNTSTSSPDASMMAIDESMDDLTSPTYRAFEAVTTTTQDVIMLSPSEYPVKKTEHDNISLVTSAFTQFGHGRTASHGVVRTSKTVLHNARFNPYRVQRDVPTHSRLNKHPLAGFGTFVNGGPYRGSKGRLVKRLQC